MSYEAGSSDSLLDAIAHEVHSRHGQELHFSEAIAREIIVIAHSLGIPNEAIHAWATDRERLIRQENGNTGQEPESNTEAQLDQGLLVAYRPVEQPVGEQN